MVMHRLRLARIKRGLTQRALSLRSGVSIDTIHNTETYKNIPRQDTRRKLLRALGMPFEAHREMFGRRTRE
jgi:transcriptional regulator with XRE-family HTH domain